MHSCLPWLEVDDIKTLTHPLWGYSFTYPQDWHHQTVAGVEGFSAIPEALQPGYTGAFSGHLLIKPEFNPHLKDVGPFWRQHIALTAGFLGAKNVGAAPWRIGEATGIEAEILLPRKEKRRLWAGILAKDVLILSFMVSHPFQEREAFEPVATAIIASLAFPPSTCSGCLNPDGIPIPPHFQQANPAAIIDDIQDIQNWQAFKGFARIDALQCFYLRELPAYGWKIQEYHPFPGNSGLGFARFRIEKEGKTCLLGIMPSGEDEKASNASANLVIKSLS